MQKSGNDSIPPEGSAPETTPIRDATRPGDSAYLSGGFVRWAFAHRPEEGKAAAAVRAASRILIIMVQEFFDTHITLRASALTFTITLSLVPLLAMSTAILKGLGSGDQLQLVTYRLIDQFDPPRTTAHDKQPEPGIEAAAVAEGDRPEDVVAEEREPSLNQNLRNVADTIFNYVDNTNFAALGAFGIVGLLITVILVFSSMEEAMNSIWHTHQSRSLLRKIMDYLALLILLPISINVGIAGDAILESPKMTGYIQTVIPSAWVLQMLFTLLPFVFITLTLMMMYLFFPHVKVKTLPALCGAVFASIFWFLVQRAYIIMQIGVAKYNAIFGSFATVPLILIWIQLGWTFILLGAALAYAMQTHNHYRPPGMAEKPQKSLQQAFDVLLAVYKNFSTGIPTSLEQLQDTCPAECPVDLLQTVDLLTEGGLLHRTADDGTIRIMPSLPADRVRAREVVSLVLGDEHQADTPGGTLADRIIRAAEEAAEKEKFAAHYLAKQQQRA